MLIKPEEIYDADFALDAEKTRNIEDLADAKVRKDVKVEKEPVSTNQDK